MIRKKKTINTEFPAQLDRLKEDILKLDQGVYEVYVTDHYPNKTIQQLRYFWGVVINTLSESLGYEKDEMYNYLCYRFAPVYFTDHETGEVVQTNGSISGMTTKELAELIDQVRRWASESLSIYIPEANEMTNDQLVELEHKGLL